MCFPNSVARVQFFGISSILVFLNLIPFFSGCSITKIYHEISPSPNALKNITSVHVEKFSGDQSILFEKILTHEIKEQAFLDYLPMSPDISKDDSSLIIAEVTRYNVKDDERINSRKQINLVEREVIQKNSSGVNTFQREFDFVEKPYNERVIHRILDLEISFKITNVTKEKTLYFKKENASFKHSYFGEENILLIPNAKDEMARLAQLLTRKFLDRINPKTREIVIELEKGTRPIGWTLDLLDFGHPRIIRSNHFATGERYDLAVKGWNYVLFEPRIFPESERFIFTDEVYINLKKAELPYKTLKSLLSVRGKSFQKDEIDVVLLGLISNQDFGKYSKIIKSHSRFTQKINRLNLASAHFNLGAVYQLHDELELAEYHFAQAHAYNPLEKYSEAWTELKHLLGNYNPLEDSMSRSMESIGKIKSPKNALLNTGN